MLTYQAQFDLVGTHADGTIYIDNRGAVNDTITAKVGQHKNEELPGAWGEAR